MTEQELQDIFALMSAPQPEIPKIEFRLYYDDNGKVITYTSEKLPGKYLVITKEQYLEARGDAIVKDKQLCYTHIMSHISKLTKNLNQGVSTSKYDINILQSDGDVNFWNYTSYEIQ